MAAGDFTGFDFVVGSVSGQRTWKVDTNGRLRGVVHDEVPWEPGVNQALCAQSSFGWKPAPLTGYFQPGVTYVTPTEEDHIAGCLCGFYAYFSGQHNRYVDCAWTWGVPVLSGVVEGFGLTVLGTKGFRASKARVTALCIPPHHDPVEDIHANRLVRWVERTTKWSGGVSPHVLGGTAASVLAVSGSGLAVMAPWLAPILAALFVAGVAVVRAAFKAIDYHYDLERARRHAPKDYTELFEKVRANYPDVKVYETEAAMLAAHPVTAPPAQE